MRTQILPKNNGLLRVLVAAALLAAALILIVTPVRALFTNNIALSQPDFSSYPDLTLQFRVLGASGAFEKDLDPNNVLVVENGQVISPDKLELLEPGLSLAVAFNEGPTLANRYAGVSRYEKVKNALITWADSKTITTMDDFSLVGNSGTLAVNLTNPAEWIDTLDAYQPDMRQAKPSLQSLNLALDLASAQTVGKKTAAVFYVTPLPSPEEMAGFQDLANRAKLTSVRLFIWLVGPATYTADEQANVLRQAALDSGGEFYLFTGEEDLPDLALVFDPLTYVYEATYRSRIMNAGTHTLSLRVKQGVNVLESDTLEFSMDVFAPNPFFINPPATVERGWTETEKRKDSVLAPDSWPLQIMIEFPDGLERDLVYTRLFVDNMLVDENTAAPFDTFDWDVSQIVESGDYTISATVEDSVGFIVETIELPVKVLIEPKPQTWVGRLFSAFTPQAIALFVIIVFAGILLTGMAVRTIRQNRTITQTKMRKLEDPLTQPVLIEDDLILPLGGAAEGEAWPHVPGTGLAPARLMLKSPRSSAYPAEIPILDGVTTIGSDPKKAKFVIPSHLVSSLHARITKDEEDLFRLQNEGSGSGTWLNYAPVSAYGARLLHGDLIQFGNVSYRFEIHSAKPARMTVEKLEDDE